eukprot:12158132-Karenia_brevis.AAC.1
MLAQYLLHALEYRLRAHDQEAEFTVKPRSPATLHVTPQRADNGQVPLVPAWDNEISRMGL